MRIMVRKIQYGQDWEKKTYIFVWYCY